MRSIFPHIAAAAAEADDAEPRGVAALLSSPRRRRIEVGHELRVRLGVHQGQQLLEVNDLGEVALAEIVVRRHRKRAKLGYLARDILDDSCRPKISIATSTTGGLLGPSVRK